MSEEDRSADGTTAEGRPTMECGVCQLQVPAGEFCGLCGGHLANHPRNGPEWLRARAFTASPGEHLLRPNVVSTLFPHLPPRSRLAFLLGLVVLLATLLAATVLRLPAVVITVAALGLPLLFLIYMQEADVFRDVPSSTLVITSALGMAIGVGWVLLTGAAVAKAYGVPLGAGIAGSRLFRDGLGVPIASMLLMLVPVALMRLRPRGTQESLDGFALGALGALMFAGAATLTRMAPQFANGVVSHVRPLSGLLIEAGIQGVAQPLTAACLGGLFGTTLWFRRPAGKDGRRVRLTLALMSGGIIALYATLGLVDIARVPQVVQLGAHLGMAAIALLALRVGLHLALLHEAHDEYDQDEPLLCWQCGHVVPDMPFCAVCGAATRASSRSSREFRRDNRPVPTEPEGGA